MDTSKWTNRLKTRATIEKDRIREEVGELAANPQNDACATKNKIQSLIEQYNKAKFRHAPELHKTIIRLQDDYNKKCCEKRANDDKDKYKQVNSDYWDNNALTEDLLKDITFYHRIECNEHFVYEPVGKFVKTFSGGDDYWRPQPKSRKITFILDGKQQRPL